MLSDPRGTLLKKSIWKAAAVLVVASLAAACGYRVAGRGTNLPAEWKTLAVVTFENKTLRYRIEQRLTEAVVREFLARTAYRVVPVEDNADAVLRGEVTRIEAYPVLFDTVTGRATTQLVSVRLKVRLTDRRSGKVIYQNDDFLFREQYEVATDVKSFFEEQDPALGRLARDFAAALVAAVLEKF
jgi:outer membrane lipopolysaccharide assembly protein LptE/RlpB